MQTSTDYLHICALYICQSKKISMSMYVCLEGQGLQGLVSILLDPPFNDDSWTSNLAWKDLSSDVRMWATFKHTKTSCNLHLRWVWWCWSASWFLLHDTLSSLQSETTRYFDFIRSTVIRIFPHKCKTTPWNHQGRCILSSALRFYHPRWVGIFWCSGDGACEVLAKQSAGSGEEMVVRSSPGSSGWVLKDS